MENLTTFSVNVNAHLDASDIATQLDHEQILHLVVEVLDFVETVEVDEALIAKLWRGIQDCYEDAEKPTLESLLEQYPEE